MNTAVMTINIEALDDVNLVLRIIYCPYDGAMKTVFRVLPSVLSMDFTNAGRITVHSVIETVKDVQEETHQSSRQRKATDRYVFSSPHDGRGK